jgi:hypothetical protein
MITNTRIFVDLDGVLNRFTPWLIKLWGGNVDLDDETYGWWQKDWLDIHDAVAALTGRHYTGQELWKIVPVEAWSEAPVSREAKSLLKLCEQCVGSENVAILTTPSIHPNSWTAKAEWIKRHFPKFYTRTLMGKPKGMCASSNTLLIDDRDKICQEFIEHGGCALLVPRPWNSLAHDAHRAGEVLADNLFRLLGKCTKFPFSLESYHDSTSQSFSRADV